MGESLTVAANALSAAAPASGPAAAGSFVLPEQRIVYIANPGQVDAPVKWLLAEVSGQDLDRFHLTRRPVRTRTETVHVRDRWRGVPTLEQYLGDPAAGGLDDDWFVFTIVYEPRLRLWATWQTRYLIGDPHLADELFERGWFPRDPSSPAQVVEDFGLFVRALAGEERDPVPMADPLRAQSDLVRRDGLRYTHVYRSEDLDELCSDLDRHLHEHGAGPGCSVGPADPLPLPLTAEVLGDDVDRRIAQVYATDLENFGAAWPDGPQLSPEPWDTAALNGLSFQRAAHRRIRDLSATTTELAANVGRLRSGSANSP